MARKSADPVSGDRLRTIHRSGVRLLGVVNDLLDLSQVEAGKLELRTAPVELGALGGEVLSLFAQQAQERGLKLACVLEPSGQAWVETDGARLQQVLINLVGNALKFTIVGSIELRFALTAADATKVTVRIAVRDTGPGIPHAQQARLFQPYVQLEGGRTSDVRGTGLGLSISRRLVELLGGDLTLASSPGVGSEFAFTLVLPMAQPPAPSPGTLAPFSDVASLRILAADDNAANREVLGSILEDRCERFVAVEGAREALAELEREAYDLAIIDLEMPDMDGYDLVREVRGWRSDERSRGCRIVAFSAHASAQVWPRCEAAGFDAYIEKPVSRPELYRLLRSTPRLAASVPA